MEIQRPIYLHALHIRENNDLIKIVTGMRRCGKSYLLFKIFVDDLLSRGIPRDHIIDIALDNIENDMLREPHTLYEHLKNLLVDNKQYYILLDEIQYVDRFTEVLNSLLRLDNVDIYVTGSNAKFLSSDILTEFRGRGDEIRIHPLSFREFITTHQGTVEEAFNNYMTFGGLPKIALMETDEQKGKYLTDLFQATYLMDILERHKIKNVGEMNDLVNILASSVGSLTNPKKLHNTFHSLLKSKISDKTITVYMKYLQEAFLVDHALRFDVKGKRYINTPLKVYFTDVGLRNARLGFRQIEEPHLMENIIFNELKIRGFNVDVGIIETRTNNNNGKASRQQWEIDFIAYKNNDKYYIQSAFLIPDENKKQQEERPLLHIPDSFKKIVVVGNNIKLKRDDNGITTMGIQQFLLDDQSLTL